MAKKQNNVSRPPVQSAQEKPKIVEQVQVVRDALIPSWLYEFKPQAIIVGLLAFVLYANTFGHEYALDDTIVIVKNEYVYEGFAGLKDILTKDAFDSYYKQFNSSNQLAGGRYRPLSIATFAIEQQFFGAIPVDKVDSVIKMGMSYEMKSPFERKFLSDMHVRHVFNVLWFTLCVIVLLYFLRYIVFKNNPIMAFMAAVLFAVHPIHTEVVANVKSRDEILSLLLICTTFILAFKYYELKKPWLLYTAMVSMFLAFLAKEYAITMVLLLPLAFYLFNDFSISKCFKAVLPYIGVVIVYAAVRFSIVASMNAASNDDILNNPYAFATDDAERLATKIATCINYIRLLLFPHPLSADYSYNTIPYKTFANPLVWLSLIIHGALFRYMFYYFKRKNVLSFAIAFYLLNLLIVCNIIFNIGGTMGERLIFHSSVGFCIAAAYLLYKGMEKIKPAAVGRGALAACMIIIVGLCSFKTIERNADWKNDETLFAHDLENAPNSVLVTSNVASSYINKAESEKDSTKKLEDLRLGVKYYDKAISIHPTFVSGYMNRGVAYLKLNMPDSAKVNYDMGSQYYPNYPRLDEIYYNLGVCFYLSHKIPQAIATWQKVMKLNPKYILAQQSINTAVQAMNAPPQPAAATQATPATKPDVPPAQPAK